eukprot:8794606-Pyramimonas_sp.AAC.1
MCSGSSSLRSRSVRSGFGCNEGLDPQGYIEHNRGMAHRNSARRITAQPSARYIKIDPLTQHCNLARFVVRPVASPPGTSRG